MLNYVGLILVHGLNANEIADSLFCHQKVLCGNMKDVGVV
jgi:hypothetical protein